MIALDTNVLARFYVLDDADPQSHGQHTKAVRALSAPGNFFVPKTVLLEFEWVLRGFYAQSRQEILQVLDHLLALPRVHIEDESIVAQAIESYRAGLDFADSLHLASAGSCEGMLSFGDKGFARKAAKLSLVPVVRVPG
jgi:predicted nucleic-acid-binding protein